jgi:predicted HNH restriction endonuclease
VLCANCHRMLHRTRPLKSVAEMQQLFARKA